MPLLNVRNLYVLICFREEDGEDENKQTWYYSTKVQLAEMLEVLDKDYWENDLYSVLEEMREEIHSHMDITEELTNKARGNNKAYLTVATGKKKHKSYSSFFYCHLGNAHSKMVKKSCMHIQLDSLKVLVHWVRKLCMRFFSIRHPKNSSHTETLHT